MEDKKAPDAIVEYRLTGHAVTEMVRRRISEQVVAQVLAAPEQIKLVRPGRYVYQACIDVGEPTKSYLVRVFVDVDRRPPDVVTVYRTSKIGKYWGDNQ
ncbi:MAG TPA: DUF4258 domain-containing protein [Chloroflexia bacterium]|jgi:hypothetical protein